MDIQVISRFLPFEGWNSYMCAFITTGQIPRNRLKYFRLFSGNTVAIYTRHFACNHILMFANLGEENQLAYWCSHLHSLAAMNSEFILPNESHIPALDPFFFFFSFLKQITKINPALLFEPKLTIPYLNNCQNLLSCQHSCTAGEHPKFILHLKCVPTDALISIITTYQKKKNSAPFFYQVIPFYQFIRALSIATAF